MSHKVSRRGVTEIKGLSRSDSPKRQRGVEKQIGDKKSPKSETSKRKSRDTAEQECKDGHPSGSLKTKKEQQNDEVGQIKIGRTRSKTLGDVQQPPIVKKKKSMISSLFFWKKDVKVVVEKKKETYVCNNFSELPEEWKTKLLNLKIGPELTHKEFQSLQTILHFVTKDSFVLENQPPREREKRSYASEEVLEKARAFIISDSEKAIKKLFKNFEFSGKGGFGRVFSAKDLETRKRVAIKKLPNSNSKEKNANLCEIGFLLNCDHPNIVKMYKAYELIDKDEIWIVSEFLEGGTLSEAAKIHQFSEKHIAYVAREMLKALKFLHKKGMVHRDLKSANVMMSVDGEIKLIDFGLCCDLIKGPRRQMLGSPYWIPPEMIKQRKHSTPADIWSFAVCILEMILREPPNCQSRIYSMFISSNYGLKKSIPEDVSELAREFLLLCLEINPKKRATAEQLLKHPFVNQPKLKDGIEDVLRGIFVSNSLALSGI